MHSWLVKGDLSAKEKEKAATKLFELDVNKSATKKAKSATKKAKAKAAEHRRARVRAQPFLYTYAPVGKNRQGEYGKREGRWFLFLRRSRITQIGGGGGG
jgi:hypothetical protein